MGVLDIFRRQTQTELAQQRGGRGRIMSSWSASTIDAFTLQDLFGGNGTPVTRVEAMKVPAIVKARALIVGPLARQPLRQYRGEARVKTDPSWMSRTGGPFSPHHRMRNTVDDLMFHGWALWGCSRDARGQILEADHIRFDRWQFDDAGTIAVYDGRTGEYITAPDDEIILFEGPQEGLVDIAADTIRGARAIEKLWTRRAETPIPLVELHMSQDVQLEDDEVTELLDDYKNARRTGDDQAVVYTPYGVELKTHGDAKSDLMLEGRNGFTLDFARYTALPAALLDASMSTASLTYSTHESKRNELKEYSLDYWADPITARLSQDDVTPRGTRVVFDQTVFTQPIETSPSGAPQED